VVGCGRQAVARVVRGKRGWNGGCEAGVGVGGGGKSGCMRVHAEGGA